MVEARLLQPRLHTTTGMTPSTGSDHTQAFATQEEAMESLGPANGQELIWQPAARFKHSSLLQAWETTDATLH
jgi:hypothetical protein